MNQPYCLNGVCFLQVCSVWLSLKQLGQGILEIGQRLDRLGTGLINLNVHFGLGGGGDERVLWFA